jgi:anaerobic selenocysteine-containing dehydrogenase
MVGAARAISCLPALTGNLGRPGAGWDLATAPK